MIDQTVFTGLQYVIDKDLSNQEILFLLSMNEFRKANKEVTIKTMSESIGCSGQRGSIITKYLRLKGIIVEKEKTKKNGASQYDFS